MSMSIISDVRSEQPKSKFVVNLIGQPAVQFLPGLQRGHGCQSVTEHQPLDHREFE
jgi:hypothetical protein